MTNKIRFFLIITLIMSGLTVNAQDRGYQERIQEIAKTITYNHPSQRNVSDEEKVKWLVEYRIANQGDATAKKSYLEFNSNRSDTTKYGLLVNMPDTIHGRFLVYSIAEKLSNYTVIDNELKEVPIYIIYLKQVGTFLSYLFYFQLISETLPTISGEEMKVNTEYDLMLFPFFDKNCCLLEDGTQIVGHHQSGFLVFNNICIFNLNVTSNYVRQ